MQLAAEKVVDRLVLGPRCHVNFLWKHRVLYDAQGIDPKTLYSKPSGNGDGVLKVLW
jgi:hypothetical protein